MEVTPPCYSQPRDTHSVLTSSIELPESVDKEVDVKVQWKGHTDEPERNAEKNGCTYTSTLEVSEDNSSTYRIYTCTFTVDSSSSFIVRSTQTGEKISRFYI